MSASKDRKALPVLGPLGELFPSLRAPVEELPRAPLHPRVLLSEEPEGKALVLVCWEDPGGVEHLHAALRQRIEAALLAELCRPPAELREDGRRPRALRLLSFAPLAGDVEPALRPFALTPAALGDAALALSLAHVRGEAPRAQREAPEAAEAVWEARIAPPPGERGATLDRLEDALLSRLGDQVWGERPGAFYAALADAASALGLPEIPPTSEGLDALEGLAIQYTPGVIRAIPPLVFQALCDTVGVVASREFGHRVEWAPSEPDESGAAPPPLLRVSMPDGYVHIPLGLHLLRWCVMPVRAGEVVPAVSEWVLDQFGKRA
jgi:hypothetical protein